MEIFKVQLPTGEVIHVNGYSLSFTETGISYVSDENRNIVAVFPVGTIVIKASLIVEV